jgi:hypothetical protein
MELILCSSTIAKTPTHFVEKKRILEVIEELVRRSGVISGLYAGPQPLKVSGEPGIKLSPSSFGDVDMIVERRKFLMRDSADWLEKHSELESSLTDARGQSKLLAILVDVGTREDPDEHCNTTYDYLEYIETYSVSPKTGLYIQPLRWYSYPEHKRVIGRRRAVPIEANRSALGRRTHRTFQWSFEEIHA